MAAPLPDSPVQEEEGRSLFFGFQAYARIGLAVSGGVDSMALMHLVATWRDGLIRARAHSVPHFDVITVDHGLRKASGEEARWVAAQAALLELPHRIVSWDGVKPRSGTQSAARDARYRLLYDAAIAQKLSAIVTAHHLDDQAETIMMRLARGSGVDGLSGMARVASLPMGDGRDDGGSGVRNEVALLRPLLTIPKSRLIATVNAHGLGWLEDPSNDNLDFERVRVRQEFHALTALGISPLDLGVTATRMRRARDALELTTNDLASRAVTPNNGLFGAVSRAEIEAAPTEIGLRLLGRVLIAHGGQCGVPRLAKVEALYEKILANDKPSAAENNATLCGCAVTGSASHIMLRRESGRRPLPALSLAPGQSALWDRRFRVSLDVRSKHAVSVRALGPDGLGYLKAIGHARSWRGTKLALSSSIARSQPSFWVDDKLVAAPFVRFSQDVAGLCAGVDYADTRGSAREALNPWCQAEFINDHLIFVGQSR